MNKDLREKISPYNYNTTFYGVCQENGGINYENIKYCGQRFGADVLYRGYFDFIKEGKTVRLDKWRGKLLWNGRLADVVWKWSVLYYAGLSGLKAKDKNGKTLPQFDKFWDYVADNMIPIQLVKAKIRRIHIFYFSFIAGLITTFIFRLLSGL